MRSQRKNHTKGLGRFTRLIIHENKLSTSEGHVKSVDYNVIGRSLAFKDIPIL